MSDDEYPCSTAGAARVAGPTHAVVRRAPRDREGVVSARLTVHSWGFVNDRGERLDRHLRHFGREPEQIQVTRDLSGWLMAVEFESPENEKAARFWHRIHIERDAWPDKPDGHRETAPTEEMSA